MNCIWYKDEFCTNGDCPYRADYCPVAEFPEICKYYKEEENEQTLHYNASNM